MMRVTDVEWNGVRWVATGGPGKESVLYSDDNGLTWNAITDSSKNLINTGMGIAKELVQKIHLQQMKQLRD